MIVYFTIRALTLITLRFSGALASPATTTVITPFGEFPVYKVHTVPEGEGLTLPIPSLCSHSSIGGEIRHVRGEIKLLDANGRVVHVAENEDIKAEHAGTSDAVSAVASTGEAFADWYNTDSPISSFSTSWTVLRAPSLNSGQTIFISASGTSALEPMLQWVLPQPAAVRIGPSGRGI